MNGINELGCDNFSCKNLVALLILCRQLLSKVNPSIDPAFNEDSKSLFSNYMNKNTNFLATVVKSMFDACFQLSDCIYHWYTNDRNCTKTGVIYALTSLFRDFAEFPFCSSKNEINIAGKSKET
jgi:hypothetical protein